VNHTPTLPRILGVLVAFLAGLSSPALAQEAASPATFVLTPMIGVTMESDVVSGPVAFSDGGVDFISIEPDAGLLLGLELGYRFRPSLMGVLALSYATADAQYIEDNNLRPDLSIDTIRIQPGVMASVLQSGSLDVGVGGGLTIARIEIDDLVWNDRFRNVSSTAIGLFGAASLDIALSDLVSFHTHLALEVTRPSYGDLEDELAIADGEAFAEVDHDLRTAAMLVVGVAFGL
jgi:hypothetical protein